MNVNLSPIAFSIPALVLDTNTAAKSPNEEFTPKLVELFNAYFGVSPKDKAAIFVCSSGKCSSIRCYINHCYELLDPDGVTFYKVKAVDEKAYEEMNGQGSI